MRMKQFSTILSGVAIAGMLALPLGSAYANSVPSTISLSVGAISPDTQITVGTEVTFSIGSSGFAEPSYSIADSFANSSVSNADISGGTFSWTPTTADIGNHELQISVKDLAGNSTASIDEAISVAAVGSVSIQSISPGSSVIASAPMGFTVQANGFTNPIYTITDSFPGSSVTNDDISQNGYFTWTPTSRDIGTHIISVRVSDYYGHAGTTQQQIVVGTGAVASPAPTAPVTTSGPTNSTVFTSALNMGSSGSQVSALQQRLTTDGLYVGPISGYYGALTEAAVKKYQTNHTVPAVGSVGPMTRALLNEGL
jgi:hypothetical protein